MGTGQCSCPPILSSTDPAPQVRSWGECRWKPERRWLWASGLPARWPAVSSRWKGCPRLFRRRLQEGCQGVYNGERAGRYGRGAGNRWRGEEEAEGRKKEEKEVKEKKDEAGERKEEDEKKVNEKDEEEERGRFNRCNKKSYSYNYRTRTSAHIRSYINPEFNIQRSGLRLSNCLSCKIIKLSQHYFHNEFLCSFSLTLNEGYYSVLIYSFCIKYGISSDIQMQLNQR